MTSKEMAKFFFALSDSTRLKILKEIFEEEKCVGKVAESLNLPIQNVSHHLRLLETSGFVEAKRYGRFIRYRAKKEELKEICWGTKEFFEKT